jgi:predicted dehydrogenase
MPPNNYQIQHTYNYQIQHTYNYYQSLVNDPDIDAIYIATTHNFPFENIKLCLMNGKHVLCEKPLLLTHTN